MHLPLPRPLIALLAVATGLSLLLDTPSARAAGNPLEQIFGQKKPDNPPPKKKKKSTSSAAKKSTNDDDDEKTPAKKSSATKKKSPSSTEKKSATSSSSKRRGAGSGEASGSAKKSTKASARKGPANVKAEEVLTAPAPAPTPRTKSSDAAAASASASATPAALETQGDGMTSSIASDELKEFAAQPERVKQLLESCLTLTRRNLTYTYGSADPAKGGMDCSGFIYFTLREAGFPDTPRQANEQYVWVRKNSSFQAVLSRKSDTFEINELRPGDLMFWTGTYAIDRDPPVTHTMIYLGTSKKTGQRLMVGSSDGRTYNGQKRNGVSVFDFHVATGAARNGSETIGRSPDFAGYGPIPGLR